MPQRIKRQTGRLDTTISQATIKKIDDLARSIERAGRRYEVSMTEVIELAIEWAFAARIKGRTWPQPKREVAVDEAGNIIESRDSRISLRMPEQSLGKLRHLGKSLLEQDGYVPPPRTIPGEASLGETIDWCVAAFHGAMIKKGRQSREEKVA